MKLWLVGLAASAASIPMAAAQTVPDPDPAYGLPQIHLNLPGAAASAATPMPAPAPAPVVRPAPVPPLAQAVRQQPPVMRPMPPVAPHADLHREMHPAPMPAPHFEAHRQMQPAPAPQVQMHREMRQAPVAMRGGPGMHHGMQRDVMMRGQHHGARHGWSAIRRGGFVPGFWAGPQFIVRNWGMYGFPQPFAGGRWIRYYDDALLVDRYGRVHDGRYSYDWDRYDDRWSDRDGVPYYDDGDDYGDDGWEGGWDERGEDMAYDHDGPPPPDCRCAAPGPRSGYGYGYGYGAYYGYVPVVVTETITTTTTGPAVESRTYYEHGRGKAEHRYRKPMRRAPIYHSPPPPPPHDGERG